MQRTAPAATSPLRAADDEGEEDEDEFLRESRELGVEFVRLLLEERAGQRNGGVGGAVPLGPGDDKEETESSSGRRRSEDGASGHRQPSRVW